jgi:hypothetical protein
LKCEFSDEKECQERATARLKVTLKGERPIYLYFCEKHRRIYEESKPDLERPIEVLLT